MNWYYSGLIAVPIICYFGYKYGKKKMEMYVMARVMDELNKRLDDEEGFTPMRKTTSAMLKIKDGGKVHSIYVPYDRKRRGQMVRHNVYLLKGEEKINISQKPGVKYMVSAKDLGGDMIVVEDKDSKVLHVYKDDEVPDCY